MSNIIYERRGRLSSRLVGMVVLFYIIYIGMCHPKGYGFFPCFGLWCMPPLRFRWRPMLPMSPIWLPVSAGRLNNDLNQVVASSDFSENKVGTLSRVIKVYQELYKSIRAYCHIVIGITVNPLLSPPGGLFFSSTFEVGLKREGGLI